jgi:glycosyltransferase involved in cell wall biosynthesis
MNLLFLNHNVARQGGTFYRAFDIARVLVERGHSVTLLTISATRRIGYFREVSAGVEIIHTPDMLWGIGRTGWDLWDALSRMWFLRGKQWDVIHAWDSRPAVILPALYARHQSGSTNAKLILDWCDWWGRGGTQAERSNPLVSLMNPVETFFEEHYRTRADGTTVISKALFHRAERLGVASDSIHLLPQGCDIEKFSPHDSPPAVEKLGLPSDTFLVGYLGALIKSDADLLWETFRLLFQGQPKCLAVLIGHQRQIIPDDVMRSGRLRKIGFVSEELLGDYLAACHVFLAPLGDTIASQARWPSKVNLFLAAGKPIVMTHVGDLAELLLQENAAAIVGCNPVELARETQRLLLDPQLRSALGERARRVAEERLAWAGIVDSLEAFYARIQGK